jgi:hypothetical protein
MEYTKWHHRNTFPPFSDRKKTEKDKIQGKKGPKSEEKPELRGILAEFPT